MIPADGGLPGSPLPLAGRYLQALVLLYDFDYTIVVCNVGELFTDSLR
jgi:hypothetical protein